MGAINEIDIAKLVLLPAILYVAKKIIDWAGKVMSSPPAKRKIRFEKVPIETKIEVLNKIAEIANAEIPDTKLSRTHQTVQMKFLYEQIGITLPVWHAHQLIAFIADKNIGSYDVRLMSFLKNPSFYRCEENHFSVDAKKIKNFHIVSVGFWLISIVIFACAWWTTIQSLLASGGVNSVIAFSLFYFISAIVVTGFILSQVGETWQSGRFARLFERWCEEEAGVESGERAVLAASEPEEQRPQQEVFK
ncbi:hypothetical protein AB9K36_08145 [Klebsiella michiganensis]|uniref:hypothetical protein n=1 Tax=Klebsiella michiganensis TaxID=1134687 RepID=UPI0015F38F19|nr:hypothetical protein [Klebsiella michiganensis]MCZ0064506.1 hypothetical protein [Klebsiella michiganensis]MCZ0080507.1 hypothetical protein [Klebsiella michiganensis]MCZ9442908.1 hypothetical protein [Klebsiella michiganensis]WAT39491.1 hypothetical protein OEE44_24480 [Klebsiella michiganensis]WAX84172.1 hypothetical protein F0A14_024660 [Klebsiella michiganensis]